MNNTQFKTHRCCFLCGTPVYRGGVLVTKKEKLAHRNCLRTYIRVSPKVIDFALKALRFNGKKVVVNTLTNQVSQL